MEPNNNITEEKQEVEETLDKNEGSTSNEKKDKKEKKKKFDVKTSEEYIKLLDENLKLKDQLLRKQAEFENFRKRTNEDRQKEKKYALYDFLIETIETLDIFDKAVSVKTDDEKLKKYLNGFIMINNRLKNILDGYGVVQMDCLNKPFDPTKQTAIETVKEEGLEANIVTEVVVTGYMYKDRVLRAAMVKVSE